MSDDDYRVQVVEALTGLKSDVGYIKGYVDDHKKTHEKLDTIITACQDRALLAEQKADRLLNWGAAIITFVSSVGGVIIVVAVIRKFVLGA